MFYRSRERAGDCDNIIGVEYIDKVEADLRWKVRDRKLQLKEEDLRNRIRSAESAGVGEENLRALLEEKQRLATERERLRTAEGALSRRPASG